MQFDNQKTRNVAEIAAKIMYGEKPVEEELKGGQKKIDKNHNGKIDGQDFAILRGEKKTNEEVELNEDTEHRKVTRAISSRMASFERQPQRPPKDEAERASWERMERDKKALQSGKRNEEVEQIDELSKDTLHGYVKKSFSDKEKGNLNTPQRQKGLRKATSRLYKEEESLDEVKMADLPSTKVQGRAYGASKPEPHAVDVLKGPKDTELKKIEAEKKKKKFSEMVNTYKEDGLKSFLESLDKKEEEIIDDLSKDIADYTLDVIDAGNYAEVTIGEEATEDEFNNEMKKAQAKSEGKDKAEVAKGSVQAVKQESTEITDEMIFEVLENAGIDFETLNDEELQEVAQEAYEILQGLSEDAEQIDETPKVDQGLSGKQKVAARAERGTNDRDFNIGNTTGGQWLGKTSPSPYKDSKVSKSGDRKGMITKSAINKTKDEIKSRLNKEETEQIEERHMTEPEMEKREKIVKSMKKGMAGFKERYGSRAKNVLYATATKQAMKD